MKRLSLNLGGFSLALLLTFSHLYSASCLEDTLSGPAPLGLTDILTDYLPLNQIYLTLVKMDHHYGFHTNPDSHY